MPPLLFLICSGRNATIFSVSILQMASVCGQINIKLFLTLLVNFTVGCSSHTDKMIPLKCFFFLFSFWQKQLQTPFFAGKQSTLQEQNLIFLDDNSMPINLNLCSFYHKKYHQRHHIIHLQNLIQQTLFLFASIPLSLQNDLLLSLLRLQYSFDCNVSTSFFSEVSAEIFIMYLLMLLGVPQEMVESLQGILVMA
jgi:hypothetical protein